MSMRLRSILELVHVFRAWFALGLDQEVLLRVDVVDREVFVAVVENGQFCVVALGAKGGGEVVRSFIRWRDWRVD